MKNGIENTRRVAPRESTAATQKMRQVVELTSFSASSRPAQRKDWRQRNHGRRTWAEDCEWSRFFEQRFSREVGLWVTGQRGWIRCNATKNSLNFHHRANVSLMIWFQTRNTICAWSSVSLTFAGHGRLVAVHRNGNYRHLKKKRCSKYLRLRFNHRSSNRNVRTKPLNHIHGPFKITFTDVNHVLESRSPFFHVLESRSLKSRSRF